MTIPIPDGMTRGQVTWKIGHDRAGTTLLGAAGKVVFEPTARAVSYATTTVLPQSVETAVTAGVMTPVSLTVNDPAVWSWMVTPYLGVDWPPFVLDVTAAGVDLANVDLIDAAVPTRVVTAEQLTAFHARIDKAEASTAAVASTVEKIKLANVSAGSGAPKMEAPVGWVYEDIATGDIWQMEA